MKRIALTLLALVALLGAANAQVSGVELGYCDGKVSTAGQSKFSVKGSDKVLSAAIWLPAETMQMFKGCEIRQIHAGMASVLNIDWLGVWVRTSLDGEDLAKGYINKDTEPKLAKGWNLVDLEEAYVVPEDCAGVYVGLSFHQKSTSVGLSVLTPDEVQTVEGGLFVQLGQDAEWEDRHAEGTLAIEAMVFGDNLPKYNLQLKDLQLDSPAYVIDKDEISGSVTVRNLATVTITGFDIACEISGLDGVFTVAVEEPIAYNEEKTIPFTIRPGIETNDPENRTLTVTIANLKEGEDQNPADNTLTTDFLVIKHDYRRQVLIEEFTTEQCPNCPRVANIMHSLLGMDGVDERVNVICHHSAYYTDWLTIPADRALLWLFNMGGSTYAPATLVDRAHRDYIANDSEYASQSPIHMPQSAADFYNVVMRKAQEVAFVCVNVDVELQDDGVYVKVTGERAKENFTVNPPRIVVGVIEDNIKAHSQAGGGSNFIHQHVNRTYNSTWGEEIEWNGDEYTYECQLRYDKNWEKENLSVVAYIWDYDPDNVKNCEVSNSGRSRYADWTDNTSGVNTIDADTTAIAEYYTLDGLRISAPAKGVNIVRNADGTTSKVIIP